MVKAMNMGGRSLHELTSTIMMVKRVKDVYKRQLFIYVFLTNQNIALLQKKIMDL